MHDLHGAEVQEMGRRSREIIKSSHRYIAGYFGVNPTGPFTCPQQYAAWLRKEADRVEAEYKRLTGA